MTVELVDYVSTLEGRTTDVRGRFNFSGPTFQFVADGAIATGGPGQAPGSLDLLVASLSSCLLNRLRGAGDADHEVIPARPVRLYARTERYMNDPLVGSLAIEVYIGGVTTEEAHALIADYKAGCRIHRALLSILNIDIIGYGEPLD